MSEKIPRTDAKLKRLNPEQQETLWAFVADLKATGQPQNSALLFIRTQFGFSSSSGALSEWLSWYAARQRTNQREQALMGMLTNEREKHPEWTDDFIFAEGQRLMAMLTLTEEDPKGWAAIQRTARDREASITDRQRFKRETLELFVKWFADKRAAEILSSGSTHEEKLKALDQAMFPEDWGK